MHIQCQWFLYIHIYIKSTYIQSKLCTIGIYKNIIFKNTTLRCINLKHINTMSRHFIFSINHNEKWDFPAMFIFPYCRSKYYFFHRVRPHAALFPCAHKTNNNKKRYISSFNQRYPCDLFVDCQGFHAKC